MNYCYSGEMGINGLTAGQNIPNPFRGLTEIPVVLEKNSNLAINIYDLTGRLVSTPYTGKLPAGNHRVAVSIPDLEKGMYLYEVVADYGKQSFKMMIE